jgi:two-component system chemotaxis response regulator CheY
MTKTVLIADDSPTMRRMLGDALRSAGFDVVEGINGEDALKHSTGRKIDLVITDFNMPVLGGIGLVKRLRAQTPFRFTPIIVLTTESGDDRKQEGRAAGATGWMVKPFDPTKLIQVVKRLMP